MDLISIENFDKDAQEPPYLTSPRSLEACKRRGVDPSELLFRGQELFMKGKVTKTDKEIARQHFEHYEKRRVEKVEEVKEERLRLIEEEKNGDINFMKKSGNVSVRQDSVSMGNSTLIDREKRELEKLQRKQAQEIQQMVEYEKKLVGIRMRNEAQDQKMREKEMLRQKEIKRIQLEGEARKLKEDAKRRKLKEEEEAELKAKSQEEHRKAQKRAEEEELKEKERIKEAKTREKEREKRAAFLKANTMKIMEDQQRRFDERKKLMESREMKRLETMQQKHQMRQELSEKAKIAKEKKLTAARGNLAAMNEALRETFDQRQKENEIKRISLEKKRQEHIESLHQRGLEKAKQIEQVSLLNKEKEEEKFELYQQSVSKAQKLQEQLQREKEKEMQAKLEREKQKEEHIALVRDRMRVIEADRVKKILDKQTKKEVSIVKIKEKQQFDGSLKRTTIELKRKDRFDAVQKMGRIQEYQKLKVLAKIQMDAQRASEIQ